MSKKNTNETFHNVSEKERSNLMELKDALKNGFSDSAALSLPTLSSTDHVSSGVAMAQEGTILEASNVEYKQFSEESIIKAMNCVYVNHGNHKSNISFPSGLLLGSPSNLSLGKLSIELDISKKNMLEYGNLASAKLVLNANQLNGGTGTFTVSVPSTNQILAHCDMKLGKFEFDLTDVIINSQKDIVTVELMPVTITQDATTLNFDKSGNVAPHIEARYVYTAKLISPRKELEFVGGTRGSVNLFGKSIATSFKDTVGAIGLGHTHNHINYGFGVGNGFKLNIDERIIKNGNKYVFTDAIGDSTVLLDYYYYTDDNGNIVTVTPDTVEVGADGVLTSDGKRVHREVVSEEGLRANVMNSGVKNAKYIEERQSEIVTLENAVKNYKDALNEYVKTKEYASGDKELSSIYEDKAFTLDENNEIGSFEAFFKDESGYRIMTKAEANNYRSMIFQKMSLENAPEGGMSETVKAINKKQIQSLDKQIAYAISNSGADKPNEIFKQYMLKKNELETLKTSTPIAIIKDGDTVKGYNEGGRLIAIYTSDGNTTAIERDMRGRAIRMYDSKDHTLDFTYNADGNLTSVNDENGNFTEYTYDANGYLIKVIFSNNDSIEFSYDSAGHIASIVCGKYKTVISYSGNAVTSISKYALFSALSNGVTSGNETLIETVLVSGNANNTAVKIESVTERYEFNSSNDYSGYLKEIDGKVVEAERYTYMSGYENKTEYAALSSLNTYSLSNYSFVCGEIETKKLNAFNLPIKVTKSGKCLDVNGSTKTIENSVADYTYNAEQKPVKIITEITTKKGSAESKRNIIERFSYDGYGRLIKSMSYVEGEEEKNGVSIEVSEYGEDGNVKTYSYNTLSSSDRIVSDSESKETDRSVIYGLDRFGNVNSVNGDNGDGEANVSDSTYTHGLLTRVKSGSTDIKYGYDHKGRVKSVSMNGVDNYLSVNYSDNVTEDGKKVNKVIATLKGDKLSESVYDLSGNLVKVKYNNAERVRFNYDSRRRLSEIKDSVIKYTTKNTYDTLDRLTKYEFTKDSGSTVSLDNVKEEYTYNNDGLVSKKVETVGSSVNTYTYTYDNDSEKKLVGMSVGSLGYGFEYDGLKRKRNKKITVSGNKIADERISYRRDGESATVNIAGIRYGNYVDGKFVSGEGIKYVYDENGNITATYVNGTLSSRYRYDRLSRLVREDNKAMKKTYTFEYDDSGNITYKGETAFTLAENLDENSITLTAYGYDGDRLMRFGNEVCEYDGIGNPTKYRSKTLVWSNGRELTKYDSTTFTYDGEGRRVSKNSNRYAYSSDNRLIKESRGIEYIYDSEGVAGIKYGGATYHMQKNGQGDVIMLLDNSGKVVVRYTYDAWGNHTVQNPNGTANTDTNFIGNINPIRYRSYYYDTETGLYFLKSRYYDPKTGRFISIDDISYIDTNTVNGINLYAYCLNNPVMMVDPSGRFAISSFLIGLLIAVGIGATVGAASYTVSEVVSYAVTGQMNWSWGMFGGSVLGGAFGGAVSFILPGVLPSLSASAILSISAGITGFSMQAIGMSLQNELGEENYSSLQILGSSLFAGGISAITAFATSMVKINGFTGRGSISQVAKQINTKFWNGTIKRITTKTLGKMFTYEIAYNIFNMVVSIFMNINKKYRGTRKKRQFGQTYWEQG